MSNSNDWADDGHHISLPPDDALAAIGEIVALFNHLELSIAEFIRMLISPRLPKVRAVIATEMGFRAKLALADALAVELFEEPKRKLILELS